MHPEFYDLHDVHPSESVGTLVLTVAVLMMLAGLMLFFFRLFPTDNAGSRIDEAPTQGQAMDGTAL